MTPILHDPHAYCYVLLADPPAHDAWALGHFRSHHSEELAEISEEVLGLFRTAS